jgi:hypothetical protein
MVRWRGVSNDSAGRTARSESALEVSLSLIRTNVTAFCLDIKHVFEVCRGFQAQNLSVARLIVFGMCNSSITCSVFEHTIDYSSNK